MNAAAIGRLAITVVGNPGLDTLVMLDNEPIDLACDGYFVRNIDTVGSAASFTARGCQRLGHHTSILGSLGGDPAGDHVRQTLAAEGINVEWIFSDPVATTRSVNLVHLDGRRTFFFDGGSHMTAEPPVALVHAALSSCDLVFSSLPNWGRSVVAQARAAGIPVAVDLQDVRDVNDPYRRDFIANSDYLFASAAHISDPVAAATLWMRQGPALCVVFGMGSRGALLVERVASRGGVTVTHQEPPALDMPIIDTTGCGDALACGYLDGILALGLDGPQALRRGQLCSRITAAQIGGDHLATPDQIRALDPRR